MRSVSPTWESPSELGFDLDYTDEQQDEDDTSADDSVSLIFYTLLSKNIPLNLSLYHSGLLLITVVENILPSSSNILQNITRYFFSFCILISALVMYQFNLHENIPNVIRHYLTKALKLA